MLPKYSFRDRVKKGFTVSERRTSLKDDKTQIIMLSNPIFKDGKCVGIISAVIELKGFARAFHSNTANAFAEDRKKAMEAGMNDHVAKPVDMKVLTAVLQKYLEK